ncbi:MAG TPA: NAD(P)/FAD-dependent oxidoreductase [Kofleriaceae bacterium]|nr:NAD(P)/FAD-dependent oxidoreductase [Kofleriaceae bacterium]
MRIVIVGAGPAGLAMGMRLKRAGHTDFTIVERSRGVGGTWHDNRYPGAGCDVPSHLYCFSFAPKPDWQHKFARQPEIEAYFQRCVEREGLASHLQLGTEVHGAEFVDGSWRVRTSSGELTADVLVSGTGQLNRPHIPAFPGLDTFAGTTFHSARWNHDYDLRGKRVVVIGNGASAAQFVPEIAQHVGKLTLLQRTPAYVFPRKDRAYFGVEKWLFKYVPGWRRFYRSWIYWTLESRFTALFQNSVMGQLVKWMMLRHLRKQVADPKLRATLTPNYPVGCKRIVISDDWYPALQRDNVALVTSLLERITADAVITADGATHPADAIIFATGFESTSFLAPMQIVGKTGTTLAAAWQGGAEAHRGVLVSGFPNLFLLYGPNTNLGHSSILFMIECQVRYVLGCLDQLARRGARWVDVKREAMAHYNDELQQSLTRMTWAADCHNWYKTDDGKITNNWSGHTTQYWWRTRKPNLDELEIS